MKRRRRTEVTLETRLCIIRRSAPASAFCAQCPVPVPLVTPEEAAVLASVSTRTIYRWVEAEQLHYSEMPEGLLMKLLVCPNSLPLSI